LEGKTRTKKIVFPGEQAKVWLGMDKKIVAERRLPLKELSEWLRAKAECKTADPCYKKICAAYFEMEKNHGKTSKFRKFAQLLRKIRAYEMHNEPLHANNCLIDVTGLLSAPVARHQRVKRGVAD